MTTAILLLIIGIIVDIFIIRMHKKEAEMPFIPEWKFDENVTAADEGCNEIFMQSQRVLAAEDAKLMPRSRLVSGL